MKKVIDSYSYTFSSGPTVVDGHYFELTKSGKDGDGDSKTCRVSGISPKLSTNEGKRKKKVETLYTVSPNMHKERMGIVTVALI